MPIRFLALAAALILALGACTSGAFNTGSTMPSAYPNGGGGGGHGGGMGGGNGGGGGY